MTLIPGTRLGPYEVVAPLGAGGMGEVYRARDTRLGREVAVKVLPPSLAGDPSRLRRFEQEARAAGNLNHPNILAIYDVGNHEGAPYLVSELLEGETLRERLTDGALPIRKAVDYTVQITRGLAAAHEKGIVHRDLKPDNLVLTRDGVVKILDFGLAKLARPKEMVAEEPDAPTLTRDTDAGTVLGTVGYMSPEQVRGESVDHRADIFSFGVILYEMLTGLRPFKGETAVETMNAILKEDPPDILEINRNVPLALERIVRHCLEKRPSERFQSARDLGFHLEALSTLSGSGAVSMARAASRKTRTLLLVSGAMALLVASIAVAFVMGEKAADKPVPSFRQLTFHRGRVVSARFSPDGHTVLYSAAWEGNPREVFSTRLDSRESIALGLAGSTVLATAEGEMAVELDNGTLARLPITGGVPREILEGVYAADWSPDGTSFAVVREIEGRSRLEFPIGAALYEGDPEGPLASPRISPRGDAVAFIEHDFGSGGSVAVVDRAGNKKTLSAEWSDLGWAVDGLEWSPDGEEIWFTAEKVGTAWGLYAVTLSRKERLVARVPGRLNLQDISADGRVLLTQGRMRAEVFGLTPGESRERDFTWLDGTTMPILSADGKTIVFTESFEAGGALGSIYLRGTDRSPPVRLADGWATDLSPDGKWVISRLATSPPQTILLPTGAGETKTLSRGSMTEYRWPIWFPDGKRILIEGNEADKPRRLFLQDISGGDPRPITPEGTEVGYGFGSNTASPDGRFVAAAPGPWRENKFLLYPVDGGEPRPIPGIEVGERPWRWSADGRYLFLREGGGANIPIPISRLDLQTGRKEPWMELSPADLAGVSSIPWVSLTPDGRSYTYAYFRYTSDLYLVDGLE